MKIKFSFFNRWKYDDDFNILQLLFFSDILSDYDGKIKERRYTFDFVFLNFCLSLSIRRKLKQREE